MKKMRKKNLEMISTVKEREQGEKEGERKYSTQCPITHTDCFYNQNQDRFTLSTAN